MPRKDEKLDERWFEEQVVMAFKSTTTTERFQIAYRYCTDYSQPEELSNKLQLAPLALIVASMLDIGHPLLESNTRNVTVTSCAVDCLKAALRGVALAIPVLSTVSVHTPCVQPVYSLCTSGQKVEFVHRDAR